MAVYEVAACEIIYVPALLHFEPQDMIAQIRRADARRWFAGLCTRRRCAKRGRSGSYEG